MRARHLVEWARRCSVPCESRGYDVGHQLQLGGDAVHVLYILKELAEQQLVPVGYELRVEAAHPDAFGSYFATYGRGDHEVRFVWDGKDGWGFLEHRGPGADSWGLIGSPVPEDDPEAMREAAALEWPGALAPIISE